MPKRSASDDGLALRPRARLLRTLGEELISSETVAILELVKNSYDADARLIVVRFSGRLEEGQGRLEIEDDGHGMNLATVRSVWLEPATDAKKKARLSQYLKRRLLGEKGVGRFAAARLASELELITRPPGSEKEVYAFFDWSQFDQEDLYLDEVLILTEERTPEDLTSGRELPVIADRSEGDLPRDGTHGTILRMSRLKRTWRARELDDLRRGLSRLVSPFDQERDFRIFLQLPEDTGGIAEAEIEAPEIIKYPHYSIEGGMDAGGRCSLTLCLYAEDAKEVIKGWFRHPDEFGRVELLAPEGAAEPAGTRPVTCGPLSFKVLVWDRDKLDNVEQKLGTGIRDIRRDLDAIAGISIYRDGFRVLPYGEPDDDWLRLDIRRVQNPTIRLSNNQITGYVKIGADTNPRLRDQSNREGLDRNEAFTDLQQILVLSLARLEQLRYAAKRPGKKTTEAREGQLLDAPDVGELRQQLTEKLAPDDEAIKLLDETAKQWEAQVVRLREVLSRYHSLATLGQLVDKVVHDTRQPLSTIQTQTALTREAVDDWMSNAVVKGLHDELKSADARLEDVLEAASLIDSVLNRIEPLGGRRRGRPTKVYLEEVIRSAFTHFDGDIKDLGIKVTLPPDDHLVQVDPAELQQVIINLLSNSVYWLRHVPKGRRAIVVRCTRPHPGQIEIVFADSGPGIPAKNRQSIFEPYFTTKPDGVGLGLVIAGEIVRDYYDGSLELLKSGPLPGAAFRIVLRKRI